MRKMPECFIEAVFYNNYREKLFSAYWKFRVREIFFNNVFLLIPLWIFNTENWIQTNNFYSKKSMAFEQSTKWFKNWEICVFSFRMNQMKFCLLIEVIGDTHIFYDNFDRKNSIEDRLKSSLFFFKFKNGFVTEGFTSFYF